MRKAVSEIMLTGVLVAIGSAEKIAEARSAVEHRPGINIAALVASKKNEQNPMLPVPEKSSQKVAIGKSRIQVPGILPHGLAEVQSEVSSLLEKQKQEIIPNFQNKPEGVSLPGPTQPKPWEIHGFAEQQFRPGQDFQSSILWAQASKTGSKSGFFSFSQYASRLSDWSKGWWQTYAGPYFGANTKIGYLGGGVAAGVEAGPHPRFAGYGVFAPKDVPGLKALWIVEKGKEFWNRLELTLPIVRYGRAGFHHQTGLGNGINGQWDPNKNWQVFGTVTYDNTDGKVKAMAAIRRNF